VLYDYLLNSLIKFKGGGLGNLPHWRDKIRTRASKFLQLRHNEFVAVPLKKPDDAGYPKCPVCVFTDVPVDTPLLKVYDYGPFGARFFGTPFCSFLLPFLSAISRRFTLPV
jgi:hypothetical protein